MSGRVPLVHASLPPLTSERVISVVHSSLSSPNLTLFSNTSPMPMRIESCHGPGCKRGGLTGDSKRFSAETHGLVDSSQASKQARLLTDSIILGPAACSRAFPGMT